MNILCSLKSPSTSNRGSEKFLLTHRIITERTKPNPELRGRWCNGLGWHRTHSSEAPSTAEREEILELRNKFVRWRLVSYSVSGLLLVPYPKDLACYEEDATSVYIKENGVEIGTTLAVEVNKMGHLRLHSIRLTLI